MKKGGKEANTCFHVPEAIVPGAIENDPVIGPLLGGQGIDVDVRLSAHRVVQIASPFLAAFIRVLREVQRDSAIHTHLHKQMWYGLRIQE